MNSSLVSATEQWVVNVYDNAAHLLRTGYWVKKLDPHVNDVLYIAAITHDIERAFKEGRRPPSPETKDAKWDDKIYSLWHGKRSGKYIKEFLQKNGASEKLIGEVINLVEYHEVGGWKEADNLRDADSLSFLEVNTDMFISWIPDKLTMGEVKEKFDYMFNRIGSDKARKLAEPYYKKAINKITKIN